MSSDTLNSTAVAQAGHHAASADADGTLPDGALELLPRSRVARAAVWLATAALGALVFSAWLRPNMIFDLADMVFCN